MDFESALQKSIEISGLLPQDATLKPEQKEVLKNFYNGKDTLALMPTGFGKSLIFQLTPYLTACKKSNSIERREEVDCVTLIICPLNAIMKSHVRTLSTAGVQACYLDYALHSVHTFEQKFTPAAAPEDSSTDSEPEYEGEEYEELLEKSFSLDNIEDFNLIYSHPEALLSSRKGKKLIKKISPSICCLAIDEVHMVEQWGPKFRKDFSKIKDIVTLLPEARIMLLTATAPKEVQDYLISTLELHDICKVSVNPDRPNIEYQIKFRGGSSQQDEYFSTLLEELAAELKNNYKDFPQTILYTGFEPIIQAITYFDSVFQGKDKYFKKEQIAENMKFHQYHIGTTSPVQDIILNQLTQNESGLKLVFATNCLGMGLDARHIRRIIHFKAPAKLDEYIQQVGRAGRDGEPATVILHYNNTDVKSNRPGIQQSMVDYCKETGCLRHKLLSHLGFAADPARDPKTCCSYCNGKC